MAEGDFSHPFRRMAPRRLHNSRNRHKTKKNNLAVMDPNDQFTKLPMPIWQHIMSFLAIKDAARTSILSKSWNSAWSSFSSLNFGDHNLMKPNWINIVTQVLANLLHHNISIQRFVLKLPSNRLKYVDLWMYILVACNIKELRLDVGVCTSDYKLPEAIFAAKALNVLALGGFKLELPSRGIKFSSLRELHLVNSFLDEQVFQALCARCSQLEVLSFKDFGGPSCLQVAGTLPKLRTVYFLDCPYELRRVDIAAPNLIDLNISSFCQELNVIKITACKTLRNLKLCGVVVTDQWLEDLVANLPNLELFYMSSCSLLKSVRISSDRLKYFRVVACSDLIVVDLDTPNLVGFRSDVRYARKVLPWGHVDALPTFKLKTSGLLEATLNLIMESPIDTHWYSKLTMCLGNFNHLKSVALSCKDDKVIVIPKKLRKTLLPPLYDTRLHVEVKSVLNHSVMDLLDSLSWISPQLDTLCFESKFLDRNTLKFTYRNTANDEDEKPCCASLPWKCWRHELKKVKLLNFTCFELPKLRNFFLTSPYTPEIIEDPPGCSLCTSSP